MKRAWSQAKNAAVSLGHSVRNFFTNLGGARGANDSNFGRHRKGHTVNYVDVCDRM